MSLIRPFAALRPPQAHAADVLAPPYDVLNRAEAAALAQDRPWSFLHVSRAEIDLAEETDPYDPAVYARAAENLARMRSQGILVRDPVPGYYVYRLVMGTHTQYGLVAAASVADYDTNRIRRHEFTRPQKEDDRVRQIDALDAQTGPVLLAYRHTPEVTALLTGAAADEPTLDVTAPDGVRHSLWRVQDVDALRAISQAFDAMPALYIADGHHRSAAASRVAAARRAANPNHRGDEDYNYFLSVIFPDSQMQILDYNRVIKDLNGLTSAQLLQRIGERFEVTQVPAPVAPAGRGQFGMYLEGLWYQLDIGPDHIPGDDPVRALDVSLLADNLIQPLLGIDDPRRDPRIDFVGGIRGLDGLQKRVDSGDMALAFALHPTSMADLMAVADAGEVMPPKSTWFEPKLGDGLVSHLLGD